MSLDLIVPGGASDPTGHVGPDFLQTVSPEGGGNTALTANTIYLRRFRLSTGALQRLTKGTIFVATAAGNADICWYSSDGTTLTLLGNSGSIAVAGTNALQELALLATTNLPLGVDLFAGGAFSSTATVFRSSFAASGTSAIAAKGNQFITKAAVVPGSLPSTVALSGFSGTSVMPWVFFE